ncbi:MAG: GNAT family N-acetyltransferase [Dysgonamonadaceae bacterium]|nr:GNAT family N-acetyltransferase [Dysgonamonadaceae bacterium]
MIRKAKAEDAAQIADIYNYYVLNTVVTFDEEPVTEQFMRSKIGKILSLGYPFLVYERDGTIAGYAYLSDWRPHAAYRITLETSVYLAPQFAGKGLGSELYGKLIEEARRLEIRSLIGVLGLPNEASQGLHRKFGFALAGCFPKVGKKFGQLWDVEFYQLTLV